MIGDPAGQDRLPAPIAKRVNQSGILRIATYYGAIAVSLGQAKPRRIAARYRRTTRVDQSPQS